METYNNCNIDDFRAYLTKDLEFYHDKGGLTVGLEEMLALIKEGVCGNANSHLRREAVEGTVQLFPLNNYGAILTGEHLFYLTENGQPERVVEKAKFTHIWRETDGQWKMARVVSYDHQPVSENSFKTQLLVPVEKISRFVGQYEAPNTGSVNIMLGEDKVLQLKAGKMQSKLYPETETLFFMKEAPIIIEFITDENETVLKFVVRENGNIVEEAKRVK